MVATATIVVAGLIGTAVLVGVGVLGQASGVAPDVPWDLIKSFGPFAGAAITALILLRRSDAIEERRSKAHSEELAKRDEVNKSIAKDFAETVRDGQQATATLLREFKDETATYRREMHELLRERTKDQP
jgi:hypothetical protein